MDYNVSILNTIKKALGLSDEYTPFDSDVLLHVNSAFATLTQLGVGPKDGFVIHDYTATWIDYLANEKLLEFVKSYVYMKVRLMFDPPANGAALESLTNLAKEYEWRITVAVDEINARGTSDTVPPNGENASGDDAGADYEWEDL